MPTKKPQNDAASQSVAEPEVAEVKTGPRKLSLSEVMSNFGAPAKPVLKTITFTDKTDESEVTSEVWVKRLSFGAVQKINDAYKYQMDEDGNPQVVDVDRKLIVREQIAQSICSSEKGDLLFADSDQVADLSTALASSLYQASDEVNNFSGKSKTAS